jgi:hypothetical protein
VAATSRRADKLEAAKANERFMLHLFPCCDDLGSTDHQIG